MNIFLGGVARLFYIMDLRVFPCLFGMRVRGWIRFFPAARGGFGGFNRGCGIMAVSNFIYFP